MPDVTEVIDSLSPAADPLTDATDRPADAPRKRGRPKKVVMLPGDKIAKPDEMDVLEGAAVPNPDDTAADEDGLTVARELLDSINHVKSDDRRWNSYAAFQRYAMVGARIALLQILGGKDDGGKPANFNHLLGVDIRTHRALGSGGR